MRWILGLLIAVVLVTSSALAQQGGVHGGHGMGMGRGMGMGMGHGMGHSGDMQSDMSVLHAMFASRNKIKRTVTNLPNGAVATTESDDDEIAALIKSHVPSMESRVQSDEPLPPMTFHPIFVALIENADKYTLEYEETPKGVRVTYQSDDPYVIRLTQEHAKLVSRFIENGRAEIHKPYRFPANMPPPPQANDDAE